MLLAMFYSSLEHIGRTFAAATADRTGFMHKSWPSSFSQEVCTFFRRRRVARSRVPMARGALTLILSGYTLSSLLGGTDRCTTKQTAASGILRFYAVSRTNERTHRREWEEGKAPSVISTAGSFPISQL